MTRQLQRCLLLLVLLIIICLCFLLAPQREKASTVLHSKIPNLPGIPKIPKIPKIPDIPEITVPRIYPFTPAAHAPADQKNSSGLGSKWYSNWQWLNPFSSYITLNENQSVLPPLEKRSPVYTYYDWNVKNSAERESDRQLLLTWRRAWYAQGFRPVVLGPAEAENNPRYETFATLSDQISPTLKTDFLTWLAWGTMETGIMVNASAIPIASYNDDFLVSLRMMQPSRQIIKAAHSSALFAADRAVVNAAIDASLNAKKLAHAKDITELVPEKLVRENKTHSIAIYNPKTLRTRYASVWKEIEKDPAAGKLLLRNLMNSHLHLNFFNEFISGIHLVHPFAEQTAVSAKPLNKLASVLANCSAFTTPILNSCPPNRRSCVPCSPQHILETKEMPEYRPYSNVFTIGLVPHPYTLATFGRESTKVNVSYIRREVPRDEYVTTVSQYLFKHGLANEENAVATLKKNIAGPAKARNLWFPVEWFPTEEGEDNLAADIFDDLEWHFGFLLPRHSSPEEDKTYKALYHIDDPLWTLQYKLLAHAKKVVYKDEENPVKVASEAWSVRDTGLWRFVRAFRLVLSHQDDRVDARWYRD